MGSKGNLPMHAGTTALLPFPILPWRKRIAVLLFLLGWLASNDLSSHSGLLGALIWDSVLNCHQRMRSLPCLPLKTDPCQQRTGLSFAHLVSQLKLLPGQCKRETLKKLSWFNRPPNSSGQCCAYWKIPHNFHPHFARIWPEVHCCLKCLHWIGGFLQISSLRIRSKLYQISSPLVFPAPAPAPHLGLHWQRNHPCFHQPVNSISGWREVKESNREEKHFLPFQLDNDSDFADMTLVCEDGPQLKAHKVILDGSRL